MIAFILTRSTTPSKPPSEPIGSWMTAGVASRRLSIISTVRKKLAPVRSILLTKHIRGTLYLLAWRQTVSVCGSTPATESNTATAPSSTRSERSTSIVKSTWPGRVDDVDAVVVPERGGRRRRDRDAALLLLGHVVHDRGALVDLTDLVGLAGVVEDALGRRGLAGIDVGHDADVAVALEGELTLGHCQITLTRRRTNTRRTRVTSTRVGEPRRADSPGYRADGAVARARSRLVAGRRPHGVELGRRQRPDRRRRASDELGQRRPRSTAPAAPPRRASGPSSTATSAAAEQRRRSGSRPSRRSGRRC